ncbi:MAG TPA: cytochrome c [Steroidobacteraceae bacterium]|nr:cytochrome c [Steroidobacteraceae bacterium]
MRTALLLLAIAGGSVLAADPPPGRAKSQMCATCHGATGLSNAPDTPNLAGQPRIYLVAQLKAYRSGKRAHEVMSVVAKPLSDADIDDLAEWYAAIEVEVRAKR